MADGKHLTQLLATVGYRDSVGHDCIVTGLAIDSRDVRPGDLFLAVAGHQQHGLTYARQAQQLGAVAIFAESPLPEDVREQAVDIPIYEIRTLNQQLGTLAAYFHDYPAEKIKVMAVTGTNGKTSTAWLLVQALQALGVSSAYMGTLGMGSLDSLQKLKNTTPSALHIQSFLADSVSRGIACVCLEASSHALVQGRLNGLAIDTAILTNISQDHLDYHQTMTAYAQAKQRLFTEFKLRHAVINSDDAYGRQWLQADIDADLISVYGRQRQAQQNHQHIAESIQARDNGIHFEWLHDQQQNLIKSHLLGGFNVDNLLAVMATLSGLSYSAADILRVIPTLTPVPGRMNMVRLDHKAVTVVIDFAHTPDALAQVLVALSDHCQHQMWCVFGCGGNRDQSKRPQMGRIAERHAHHVIVTDDNPRFESAADIVADIASGMSRPPLIIHNRKAAIEQALHQSVKGDVVLIAGKGHETTQQIKEDFIEMNDFQVVQDWQEAAA